MKLTCDSCSAKYSIADDRVAGKVFKIRCKKCSHVIIVRGVTAAPATIEVTPPTASSGEWHAVVDGDQLGPFDRDEIVRRREAGELDDETFMWREGMPDWVALGTLDELRAQPTAPPSVNAVEATRLRNERNETSVLFTLGNLAQLASKPQPKPQTSTASSAGAPAEEGSGLIDIRALASTWAQPSASARPVAAADSMANLPVYAPIGLADPIVLVPTRSHGLDRRLLVALVAMLAMIATLAIILIVVLTRDGGTAQAAVAPAPPVVVAPPPAPAPAPTPAPAVIEPAPAPAPVAQTPAPAPQKSRATSRTPRPTPTAKSLDPVATKEDQCTDVSCAFSNYAKTCCEVHRPRDTRSTPATTTTLPDNLDRNALARGIATIKAQNCGGSSSAKGDVTVSVKVTPEGTVSGVTVKSTPDQALASCVVAEAKRGTFAKTKRGGSFSYFWRF
ncbi:MAG: zinc-ribbon domain-containing protein [Myxococcota bacterium]|nr:zinc-ribbon domain-containing protein [Deltaproteobacteria bacterium]MDQ3338769.1 zinc-ribbon domain-containing protein [Myxococcota bacterium]